MCRRASLVVFGCLCFVLAGVGCWREEEITRYRVPRISQEQRLGPIPSGGLERSAGKTARMLAAIVPQGRKTWFFKLVGPDDEVVQQQERFNEFVRSLRFTGEKHEPAWQLPDDWRQMPSSGMRFATLQIGPTDAPLELTVTPLTTGRGDINEYLLANVNRWRDQLALAKVASLDSLKSLGAMSQFSLGPDLTATVVNIVGRFGTGSENQAPKTLASLDAHPIAGSTASAGYETLTVVPLTYETPSGWEPEKASGLRQAAFEVADDDEKVEITAISLPIGSGDLISNVNRWRDQIRLEPTSEEELESMIQPISVDGQQGEIIELVGPESQKPREAIVVVMVNQGKKTWFFKLKGSAALVTQEKPRFEQFVRSVKFPQ